jgi:hypothetical protein
MISLESKIAGEYNIVIKKPDGTTKETGWFHNLILNSGLDRMAIDDPFNPIIDCVRVGTGNSTPIPTQTQLDAEIAHISGGPNFHAQSVVNADTPTYATTWQYGWAFAQGAVIGNIQEVGIGGDTGPLFSRSLILDPSGNPTTITLIAIDQLIVYYRLTMSPPVTDGAGTVTLGSTNYPFQTRIFHSTNMYMDTYFFANSNGFATPGITATFAPPAALVPLGTYAYMGPNTVPSPGYWDIQGAGGRVPYIPGTYYQDWTFPYGPTFGNDPNGVGIQGIIFGGGQYNLYQVLFPTPIPKTNTRTLSLTFRFSWNRA